MISKDDILQDTRRQASSFGAAAELYDRIRPKYPIEALRWVLAGAVGDVETVLDIGAGTGILTRQMLALGTRVLAIEPDDRMRARLAQTTPGATALAGSAESIPVPTGSADAALAGQSYHWFDHDVAHRELARVLRPGGIFAALWNIRDDAVPWVAAYSKIMTDHRDPTSAVDASGRLRDADFGPGFAPVEYAEFRNFTTLTAEELVDLVKSRSSYLTASPAGQAAQEQAVREFAHTRPELAGRAQIALPYVTRAYRARVRPRD